LLLTVNQLQEIKQLQQVCEQEGNFGLKLNWEMLSSRKEGRKDDFLHYMDGNLVGFLGIYGFGNKTEICGMVHPNYRRRGIFTKLLKEGIIESKLRGTRQILLNAPAGSSSAKEFLTKIPNHHHMTEYQMKWEGKLPQTNPAILLRPSTEEDTALKIRLEIECFGFTPQEAEEFYKEYRTSSNEDSYIIEAERSPVGKMRVDHHDGEAWIYGFAILPEHQGKGIGRNALAWIIEKEHRSGFPVFLEVEAKNAHALGLYESVGFKSYHAQDYYEYTG
jgi:ribosomal protein S18 acetylase RimI-like enzyme